MPEEKRYIGDAVISYVLEDVQDRACKKEIWDEKTLTEFTDWIRGLYPELYSVRPVEPRKQART